MPTLEKDWGYIENDRCNRNGCIGTLYNKLSDGEMRCTCHLGHPPCSFCVDSVGCCPKCGWNEKDSICSRKVMLEKLKI